MLRWLARQTGRLPWVLATHRLEDVPPSATHALLLGRGRIVYRGALRGAPLKRWLEYQPRKSPPGSPRRAARSEEHTSELQSQSNLVCRLLLEKKKQTK